MDIKTVPQPPKVQTLLPVTFAYSLSSEAVVMRQLRRWKRLWRRSLTRSHKRTFMGPSRSCWNGTKSAFQLEEIPSKGTRISCVLFIKVPIRKKSGNFFNDPHTVFELLSLSSRLWLTEWEHSIPVSIWGSRVRHETPEEVWKTNRPKPCE